MMCVFFVIGIKVQVVFYMLDYSSNKEVVFMKNKIKTKWSAALLCAVGMGVSGVASTAYGAFDTHRLVVDFNEVAVSTYHGTSQDKTGLW